jgi:hypothetical protein
VLGSPDIAVTIVTKILAASAFVGDVTIVGKYGAKQTSNANVLLELGYAFSALTEAKVILVKNTALGQPEDLLFDLKLRRGLTYSSVPDGSPRATARDELAGKLELAVRDVFREPEAIKSSEVALETGCVLLAGVMGGIHHYELKATMKNVGERRIDDSMSQSEIATKVLEPHVMYGAKVASRSNAERTLFRATGEARWQLHRGDERSPNVGYRIDEACYRTERNTSLLSSSSPRYLSRARINTRSRKHSPN